MLGSQVTLFLAMDINRHEFKRMPMATSQINKSLTSRTVETMKPGDKILADTGENTRLRVKCGASGVKTILIRLLVVIDGYSSTTDVTIIASISSFSAWCSAKSEILQITTRSSSV